MAIELKMPALSPTMEEGTLAKWLVKEGDDGQVRRHPGRDRDRQGDDGVRSGRRRQDRQDPGPGRHGRREGRRRRSRCWPARARRSARPPAPAPAAEAPKPAMTEEPSVPAPDRSKPRRRPTPHVFETAARDLVADVAKTHDEPEVPDGTPLVSMTRPRGAARRHGRGDAARTSASS